MQESDIGILGVRRSYTVRAWWRKRTGEGRKKEACSGGEERATLGIWEDSGLIPLADNAKPPVVQYAQHCIHGASNGLHTLQIKASSASHLLFYS